VAKGRVAHLRERVDKTVDWAMTTAWNPVVIARDVYERDREVSAGVLAGAIAFRLFVWLAAFVVVVVSILGFVAAAGHDAAADLGDGGVTSIAASQVATASSDAQSGRWFLLVVGLYALFSSSRTMVRTLWASSSIAAGVAITKAPLVKGVIAFNGLMLVMLGTTGGAARLRDATPGPGLIFVLAAIVVFVGIAWLGMRWLPGAALSPRDLLPGAVLLAVGFQVMHLVATLYLPSRLDNASATYGGLGVAIVLLLWLYFVGRLVMLAGVLNTVMLQRRGEPAPLAASP
jgi:membrane protein